MEPITFGSVCSGIGAPEGAWKPLGWAPAFLSEIEKFPRAVMEQRQQAVDARLTGAAARGVPLWGDFTAMRMRFFRRLGIQLPDVLVGGTPCQAFSVAGLRRSLADARGNLSLEFVRLANAIDNERARLGRGGITIVWENVPGVLSTKDNAFGCFLAAIVGADAPLVPPPGQRWTDAGMVAGPRRVAAWRTLDSQYFGLAQRRERVFVVACPLDGADPSEILLEQDGVRRDSPPRRQAQADVAGTLGGISPGGGWRFGADEAAANQLVAAPLTAALGRRGGQPAHADTPGHLIAFGQSGERDIGSCLTNHQGRYDLDTETFIAHTLRGEGFDASEDGTGRGVPLVPVAFRTAGDGAVYEEGDCTAPLTTGTDASASIVAFSCKDHGGDASDIAPTLRAMGHARSHANGGGQLAVAVSLRGREGGGTAELGGDLANTIRASSGGGDKPYVLTTQVASLTCGDRGLSVDQACAGMAVPEQAGVRRLMPVECERLQGFPDHYTLIEVRGQPATDSPRYKALGNSMSVPVMAWIGGRIDRALKTRGIA